MKDGDTHDYVRRPWRLRAVMQTDVFNEDDQIKENMVFWFVSVEGRDEWFAHAISDDVNEETADYLADSIPPAVMNVMLPLAGQRWSIISALPTRHAQSQRDVLSAIDKDEMLTLMSMNREQLLELRTEGEGDPRNPSMN